MGQQPLLLAAGASTRGCMRCTLAAAARNTLHHGWRVPTHEHTRTHAQHTHTHNCQVPTALVMFAGEQHGFRGAGAIRAALEGEMYFYGKVRGGGMMFRYQPTSRTNLV